MIVNGHIATQDPYNGLGPHVLNVPAQWVGYPKVSASGGVVTKTQRTQGSSVAAGTQPDFARNLNVVITPTQSSGGVTGGGITVYGKDVFGSTRSETFGSLAMTSAVGLSGSINFAHIDTVSMLLSFHSDTSSAASDVAVVVGVGPKLGLPVSLASSDAVFGVRLGATGAPLSTYSGATSTNNQWSVTTGAYFCNGVAVSGGFSSASLAVINYNVMGWRAPVGSY
jgi:hypothetical protein